MEISKLITKLFNLGNEIAGIEENIVHSVFTDATLTQDDEINIVAQLNIVDDEIVKLRNMMKALKN